VGWSPQGAPREALRSGGDEAGLVGDHDELDAVSRAQLREDAGDVRLDRQRTEDEGFCDFAVGASSRDEAEYFELARARADGARLAARPRLKPDLWGVPATHSIREYVPILVFAFLFGLSMDYEVFVLSRMREEYDETRSTSEAVVNALSRTGRLVTSAAIILCISFASITLTPNVDIRVLAFGLAAGILLDATVIRSLLVPALVALFGRWNWWMPARLERMLRVAPALRQLLPQTWRLRSKSR
jgi:hypothetical protein